MNQSDILAVNELKILSLDIINKAGSGNPGICMDMSAVMYSLFAKVLNVYPKNPTFFNRDRVILSSAHISPLYYAMLYMAGYPLNKEDLMNFRRLNSSTPGMPELNNPAGVDASTGVAGGGVGVAVGCALARRYLNSLIQKEDEKLNLLNFTTFCFVSDADMMSGASEEAFSFAGVQNIENLIFLYDANQMTAEGSLEQVFHEDLVKKFQNKGFYVDSLKDSENVKEIAKAIEAAKRSKKTALILFKNIIGKGSFNEGKNIVHSGVLSFDDISSLKRKYNIFLPPFEISKDSILHIGTQIQERTGKIEKKFNEMFSRAQNINSPFLNGIIQLLSNGNFVSDFDSANYKINDGYREPLIESNYKIMNLIAPRTNFFIGGSAGLSLSCQTLLGGAVYMDQKNPTAKNIRFGIREEAMSYILNGMSLLGLRVFGSTKLCFADELKSGMRLSALMNMPVTYIFTHDSIYNSEEGPVRIPVEQLAMMRSIPNFVVYRPADIMELMGTWEAILQNCKPCALVISTNSIPKLPGSNAKEVKKGAYIIKPEVSRLDGILIATGSEVVSAMQIAFDLQKNGLDLRVVSMPSMDTFLTMGVTYEEQILPKNVKTAVIEAGSSFGWHRFATNDDFILNISDFAYSGYPLEVLQKMEFDYDSLKMKIESLMK